MTLRAELDELLNGAGPNVARLYKLEQLCQKYDAALVAAQSDAGRLALEATDYLHAVKVLFDVQPEGDCLAERKPTKDEKCYRAFVYLNDQGKLLRAAVDAAAAKQQEEPKP